MRRCKKNSRVYIFRFDPHHFNTSPACEKNFHPEDITHEKKLSIGCGHFFNILKNRVKAINFSKPGWAENIDELVI